MNILGISYAKQACIEGSREHKRMVKYARAVDSYTLVVFTRRKEGYPKVSRDGNFTVYATNSVCRPMMFFDAYRLGKKFLSERRDRNYVVTAQDPFYAGILSVLLGRVKNARTQIQVHGDFFSSPMWRKESLVNIAKIPIGLWILRKAKCIRVVSQRIKNSLIRQGVKESAITVLPIRSEIDHFFINEKNYSTEKDIAILTVSRLSPEKNISLIINAFAKVATTKKNITLRIVGHGSEERGLRNLVAKLGLIDAVTFVPTWVEDVAEEMKQADIFALASNYEGYGLVLVEAMATGLPIVTTDVGCVGEVLKDGEHGIVVPVSDEKRYTDALTKLISDEDMRARLGKEGQKRARELAKVTEKEYIQSWVEGFSACI